MVVRVTEAGDTNFASDVAMAIAAGSGAIVLERVSDLCHVLDEAYFGGERVLRITSVESVTCRQMDEATADFMLDCCVEEAPPIYCVTTTNGKSYECLNVRLMFTEPDVDLLANSYFKIFCF